MPSLATGTFLARAIPRRSDTAPQDRSQDPYLQTLRSAGAHQPTRNRTSSMIMADNDSTRAAFGLWADTDTGDVDPVLARMLHLLRHHWGSDPDDACLLSNLESVIAHSRADNALSRRRALFVVDRALRRDLPRLLRSASRGEISAALVAANSLEQLAALENTRSAGCAVGLTFNLESQVNEADRRVLRAAWQTARYTELALATNQIYQLGSAAVSACEMFVLRRDDLAELGCPWMTAGDLARRLAFTIIYEALRLQN